MPVNVMLDLETLGTNDDAMVISIGACVFDGEGIKEQFFENVQIPNQPRAIDPATVDWWLSQDAQAIQSLRTPAPRFYIDVASAFQKWMNERFDRKSTLWCNGATFDFPIIRSFLSSAYAVVPWTFRQEMCMRPIRTMGHKLGHSYYDFLQKREGAVKHNALHDAWVQAEYVTMIFNMLGVPL